MGLFDDVHCKMDLPKGEQEPPSLHFQTKSFPDPYMDKYVIEKDGTMTKNGDLFAFHGVVNFYTFEKGVGQEWWEYDAKFTDGICVEITLTPKEQSK